MIKAIIFDCFGVLTTDHWKEFVSSLPAELLPEAHALNYQYYSGQIGKDDFNSEISKLTGRKFDIKEAKNSTYANKNTKLLSYIKELKPNYKIGILSNIADNWIEDQFLTPEETKLFDSMTMSFEAKMTKPDPNIFKLAADRLGVEQSECVLIDDIDRYCDGAKETGMQAIVYQNFGQMKVDLEKLLKLSSST